MRKLAEYIDKITDARDAEEVLKAAAEFREKSEEELLGTERELEELVEMKSQSLMKTSRARWRRPSKRPPSPAPRSRSS